MKAIESDKVRTEHWKGIPFFCWIVSARLLPQKTFFKRYFDIETLIVGVHVLQCGIILNSYEFFLGSKGHPQSMHFGELRTIKIH